MSTILNINTKGTCLFCMTPTNPSHLEGEENNESSCGTELKILLRYLKVDVANIIPVPSLLPSSRNGESMNLAVLTCEDCSSATSDFLEMFHQMENIRIQMDLCLRQLHEFMENGRNDAARLMEYINRSPGENNNDLNSLKIADNIRKEISEKVRQKLKFSLPRIVIDQSMRNVCTDIHSNSPRAPLQIQNVAVDPLQPIPSSSSSSSVANTIVAVYQSRRAEKSQKDSGSGTESQNQMNSNDGNRSGEPATAIDTDISELPLEKALSDIAQQMTSRCSKCLFCARRGSPDIVRKHLLQKHLSQLVEKAKSVSKNQTHVQQPDNYEDSEVYPAVPTPKPRVVPRCKCNYCGKYFAPSSLGGHEYRIHMMMKLKGRIPQSITEDNIKSTLSKIINRSTATRRLSGLIFQCLFCESKVWGMKEHLLRLHLKEVIREVNKRPLASTASPSTQPRVQVSDEHRSTTQRPCSRTSPSSHLPAHTLAKYKCVRCRKPFANKFGRKLHFDREHLKPPQHQLYTCEQCQKCFTQRKYLRTHKIRFHPVAFFSTRNPLLEEYSDKNFITALSYITGEVEAKSAPNNNCLLGCPYCDKRYERMSELRLHISCSHVNDVVTVMTQIFI